MRAPFNGCFAAVLLAHRHQPRHLGLGDGDFLAAPIGQSNVFDEVVHTLGFPLIWASDDKDIKKSLYEFASRCQGKRGVLCQDLMSVYRANVRPPRSAHVLPVRPLAERGEAPRATGRRSASELPGYGLTHSPSEVSTERLTTACVRNPSRAMSCWCSSGNR